MLRFQSNGPLQAPVTRPFVRAGAMLVTAFLGASLLTGIPAGPMLAAPTGTAHPANALNAPHAPNAPTAPIPSNYATGVLTSPTLQATVSDLDGDTLDATFYGRSAADTAPDFTLVTIPDTQFYSQLYPTTFTAQTTWIHDEAGTLNTVFVTHLGDITNNATQDEWDNASASMQVLDTASVPNSVLPGNHDFNNIALYDATFPVSRYSANSWYGGSMPGRANRDSYQLFSVGGLDFIIINLENGPDASVQTWASGVLADNDSRRAIVVTHDYLDAGSGNRSAAGNAIWTGIVSPNCNVFLVLAGHSHGENRRADTNSCGETVNQIVQDYQSLANGGDGWLRYFTFKPSENKIYAYTYKVPQGANPGLFETDANSQFTLDYDMGGSSSAFEIIGTDTGVASGGHATVDWLGLDDGTAYEWYVDVSDGSATTAGPTWLFTTEDANNAPVCSDVNLVTPTDTPGDADPSCTDSDGDPLTFAIVAQGAHGVASVVAGELHYVPTGGYSGPDTFTYEANDGEFDSNTAAVSVTVIAPGGSNALQFNGSSQYVTFDTASGLGVTTFTLELWFKRTGTGVATQTSSAAGGLSNVIPLLTKGRSEGDTPSTINLNWFLGIDLATDALAADFEESDGANHAVVGATAITNDVWHHAAATYDGTTWRLYLDGDLDAILEANATPNSGSVQHAALATSMDTSGTAAGYFAGVLDEARVWNVARSQSQIYDNKDLELTSGIGLVARWGLNEGIGTTAADSVAPVENGTLTNDPTWVPGFVPSVVNHAPSIVLSAPADDATGVSLSPTLDAIPSDIDGDSLDVTFYGRTAGSGAGSVGIVQDIGATSNRTAGQTSTVLSVSRTVTLGNLIVVGFAYFAGQGTESVTDNLGNTYTRVERSDNAGVATGSLWYAPVTAAGALTTITATHPASGDNVIQALELTAGTLSAAGGGNAGLGTAATWATNKTIPANGLALGFASTNGSTAHTAGPSSGTPSTAITMHRYYQGASILESSFVSAAAGATAVTGFSGTTTFASMYFLSAGAIFTPTSPWSLVGTDTNVASGDHATVVWAGRDPNTEYEWYARASDGALSTPSVTRSFTTGGGVVASCQPADLTADGRADVAVFRPGNGVWYISGGTSTQYGTSGDQPVSGCYTSAGVTDIAVFRPGQGIWYVNGGASAQWGAAGDIAVPGDYDGDGLTEMAVFRPGQGIWYVRNGTSVQFGTSGDIPVPADYDGDGATEMAVFRPSQGIWYVNGGTSAQWGTAGDIPVPADYDGNGTVDFAVFRPGQGIWYVNGGASAQWGASADIPVPADFATSGDILKAVFRPSQGIWYISGGSSTQYGAAGDMPIPLPAAIQGFLP